MVVQRDGVLETNMLLRLQRLRACPAIFRNLTGITLALFDQLLPSLRHAFGGGDDFDLDVDDQFMLTIFWLRHYPTQEVLGYLFDVPDSTAKRAIDRCLPLLE